MKHVQTSRRQLLQAGVACGTALSWSQRLPAADELSPLQFIIVSDTHLGRNDNDRSERQWRQAITEINRQPGQFVLHLGDVIDKGRKPQYPIYAESRQLLNKPIHEIPGNHDPTDLFRQHVVQKIDRSHDYGDVRFILFNNAHRDSHDGFITDDQITWLKQQCADAAAMDLKVVICCHVPIHSNKNPDRGWYVKPANGQKAFYELRQQYADRILICFHGHFHNGIRGWRDNGDTAEILCPSVCYNQNRSMAKHIADGKATGFYVDELRPGYVLAELGNGQLTLRYKPLGQPQNGKYSAEWS